MARYSFICFRRLRSTAMWVILWFSISSLFLAVLVRRRLRRPLVVAVTVASAEEGGKAPEKDRSTVQVSGEELESH